MSSMGMYFNSHKWEFSFSVGWYRGSEWKLVRLSVLEVIDPTSLIVFELEILKFDIYIGLAKG